MVVGSEPAAFSAAFTLTEHGHRVCHIYRAPFGLEGSSRDIGFIYPELTEPWERLSYALGNSLALEYYQWCKQGIEDLETRFGQFVERGSRLFVTRTETESKLVAGDVVERCKPPVNDEARLMSGAAASNYAPVDGAHQASFETHAIKFVPVRLLNFMTQELQSRSGYKVVSLGSEEEWKSLKIKVENQEVRAVTSEATIGEGDLALVAAGPQTKRCVEHFAETLRARTGQAFRSEPLKEKARTSVVGISASWGYERYRFDEDYRLLGCGIDPTGSAEEQGSEVDPKVMKIFLQRAASLFTDFTGDPEKVMQWAVEFTTSCDGLPILGPLPGQPQVLVAEGFGISAWSRGWEAGVQLAQAVSRGEGSEPTNPLLARCSARRF